MMKDMMQAILKEVERYNSTRSEAQKAMFEFESDGGKGIKGTLSFRGTPDSKRYWWDIKEV